LILLSDKFKNEIEFNEQVKKVWRTLIANGMDPKRCLTKDKILKKDFENPEKLEWEKLKKFECFRSHKSDDT
jgi:hypothetical protein